MVHKTQGTQLYVLDTVTSPVRVLKIAELVSIGNVGGTASKIDRTTMDDTQYKRYLSGLIDPGSADMQLLFDESDESQQFLYDNVGSEFEWAIGHLNGFNIPPTVNGSEDGFDLPATRGWITMTASINSDMLAFDPDSIVKLSHALQVSGRPVRTPKSA